MIRCRLGDIMKERGLTNKEVVTLTGVSRNTITSLSANATKRIDYDTFNGICKGLNVSPAELFEYIPDNNEEDRQE
ncbi:helix-turn-helix domain-containing protein [Aneurinibacillus aneurinilyticus]|uniref:helix-turn-helix domain-containing protein n=1 Tax=Aneurinibacillus aneurinilyticus TaxID=1391 RepID=UPI0023F23D3C|nr:helix-turn-helix transcriptional regulator [Aneurinibacillus aneurinilyticus]